MKKIIIAIDGLSSCGKSTMAKKLAKDIGYIYIDTGAMYRAVTLYTINNNLWLDKDTPDELAINNNLDNINIDLILEDGVNKVYLNGKDVSEDIRTMEVSSRVSIISVMKYVREKLTEEQRRLGEKRAIVMDGRDIGTNVFPNAELKIFVTANPKVRAERRLKEMREKGNKTITYDEVLHNIEERDYIDSHRDISPLKQADDAIVLDNSYLTKEEQDEKLMQLYKFAIQNN